MPKLTVTSEQLTFDSEPNGILQQNCILIPTKSIAALMVFVPPFLTSLKNFVQFKIRHSGKALRADY